MKKVVEFTMSGYKLENSDIMVFLNQKFLTPERSLKLRNHSPTGFNWGYDGSGPAQLALAVMLELFDKETALKHYQDFKFVLIGSLPGVFSISGIIEIDNEKLIVKLK